MYDGMNIMMESDCVLTRESTNLCKLIEKLFNQVISGFDGLGCCVGLAGLTVIAVGAATGLGSFVLGWITVMAQFILTTANLVHDGRPRMAGLGGVCNIPVGVYLVRSSARVTR